MTVCVPSTRASTPVARAPSNTIRVTRAFAANYVVNAANAGRTITGGQTSTGSINVNLLEPNKIFQQYYKIVDVRFSKTMTVGKLRTTALAECENLFNIRSINAVTQNYGANWLRPASIQRGLNVRFGLQMRF